MTGALPVVRVSGRAAERLRGGHLWVYGDDLREVPPGLSPGQWVGVLDRGGTPLGTGTLNLSSRISVRLVSRGPAEPTAEFLASRIADAWRRRAAAGLAGEAAVRLVYSEGDFLPGLVADRYGGVVVVQFLTAGMERVRAQVLEALASAFGPRLIYERSEGAGRRLEGLPERKGPVSGEGPPREDVPMDGLLFRVDVEEGPKTGFFLDQRANRRIVRDLAAGKAVLDGFCSTGGFGIYALAGGAASVVAVDASGPGVAAARANAERNGFSGRWEGVAADLFAAIRDMVAAGRRFDLVVLDPPSFARTREGEEGAVRGYKDINRLGMSLLAEGGLLATASCTQRVDMAKWREALRSAAADAGVDLELVVLGGQPPDHPVLLGVPETEYLKFAVFRKRSS